MVIVKAETYVAVRCECGVGKGGAGRDRLKRTLSDFSLHRGEHHDHAPFVELLTQTEFVRDRDEIVTWGREWLVGTYVSFFELLQENRSLEKIFYS